MKVVFALLVLIYLPAIASFDNHKRNEFALKLSKEIHATVNAQFDKNKMLDSYKAKVFTPVCEDTLCYAVELVMYWDAIGRFSHYDTIPGKRLTKRDHEPLAPEDHRKLTQLLRKKYPSFVDMEKDELVQDNDTIDGVSGATAPRLQRDVVKGAIYSCYTLWHIANGAVKDSIKATTPQYFNKSLIQKFVRMKDEQVARFLINNFSDEDFENYLLEVGELIISGGSYFAKNIIEKIPDFLFESADMQEIFIDNYNWLHPRAQLQLLQRLQGKQVCDELLAVIGANTREQDSEHKKLLTSLVEQNK